MQEQLIRQNGRVYRVTATDDQGRVVSAEPVQDTPSVSTAPPEPSGAANPYNVPRGIFQRPKEEQVEFFMNDPFLKGAATGGVTTGALTPVNGLMQRGAKVVMEKALGHQKPVQEAFPNVDLADEALKYGTNPKTLDVLGENAAKNVVAQGKAAEAAGVAPVSPREIIRFLRRTFDRAAKEEGGGIAGSKDRVMGVVGDIRRLMPRGGQPIGDALVAKSGWQHLGREAAKAAPGQLKGADSRIANDVGDAFVTTIRGRNFEPLNQALDESQSLMALQRAAQSMSYRPSLLQLVLGGMGGGITAATTGDWKQAVGAAAVPIAMSPRGLSMIAQGVKAAGPTTEQIAEAVYRAFLGQAAGSPDATPPK